jgi:hypothetical protein
LWNDPLEEEKISAVYNPLFDTKVVKKFLRHEISRNFVTVKRNFAKFVYMLLDNSCYYGRSDDGSRIAPRREKDGSYHLVGEVNLCPKETEQEHFTAIKSLLEAAGKKRCIMITPLPKYVVCSVLLGSWTLLKQEVPGLQATHAELA